MMKSERRSAMAAKPVTGVIVNAIRLKGKKDAKSLRSKHTVLSAILSAVLCLSLCVSCAPGAGKKLTTGALTLEHETRYGGIYAHITIADFNKLGFAFGDSVDVVFDNGEKLEDLPYYDGYYTKVGEPLLCGYPGYPYVDISVNNGADLYEELGLSETSTVTITLRERGKYLAVEEALGAVHSDNRGDFHDDGVFGNFRPLAVGRLKEGLIFRGASPCYNVFNRAETVSALSELKEIRTFIDLADSEEEAAAYFAAESPAIPYWKTAYSEGRVFLFAMGANYRSPEYHEKVAGTMRAILENDGPFLIHCNEGKDRTGFVCFLVGAFAGASVDELERDYMETYENFYNITKKGTPGRYDAIVEVKFDDFLVALAGTSDREAISDELLKGAVQYLKEGGMTDAEIETLREKILK